MCHVSIKYQFLPLPYLFSCIGEATFGFDRNTNIVMTNLWGKNLVWFDSLMLFHLDFSRVNNFPQSHNISKILLLHSNYLFYFPSVHFLHVRPRFFLCTYNSKNFYWHDTPDFNNQTNPHTDKGHYFKQVNIMFSSQDL